MVYHPVFTLRETDDGRAYGILPGRIMVCVVLCIAKDVILFVPNLRFIGIFQVTKNFLHNFSI